MTAPSWEYRESNNPLRVDIYHADRLIGWLVRTGTPGVDMWTAYRKVNTRNSGGFVSDYLAGSFTARDSAAKAVWDWYDTRVLAVGACRMITPGEQAHCGPEWCTDKRCGATCEPFGSVVQPESWEQRGQVAGRSSGARKRVRRKTGPIPSEIEAKRRYRERHKGAA